MNVSNKILELRKKILVIVIILLFLLPLIVIYFLKQPSKAPPSIIIPTSPIKQPSTISPPTSLLKDAEQVLNRDVKDVHWINNKDLGYTFFETESKRRVLAKIGGDKQEVILLKDANLKMSEVYWSKENNVLIFDYGNPYRAYLFSNLYSLTEIGIKGYGFSWSPEGNNFFYIEEPGDILIPKLYNISTGSFSLINKKLPFFQLSFWSPKESYILLYKYDMELSNSGLYLLNLKTTNVPTIKTGNIMFPLWAPSGEKLGYISNNNLYIYSLNGENQIVYKSNSSFLSYGWLDDNKILIFDSSKELLSAWILYLKTNQLIRAFQQLNFLPEQMIKITVSPDKTNIALATEKDGLWFIKNPF